MTDEFSYTTVSINERSYQAVTGAGTVRIVTGPALVDHIVEAVTHYHETVAQPLLYRADHVLSLGQVVAEVMLDICAHEFVTFGYSGVSGSTKDFASAQEMADEVTHMISAGQLIDRMGSIYVRRAEQATGERGHHESPLTGRHGTAPVRPARPPTATPPGVACPPAT